MVAVLSAVPVVPGQCVICSLFSQIFNIYIYIFFFFSSKCLFFYELFYKVFMLFYLNLIYIFMCIYLLPVVPGQCVICSLFSHIFNIYIYLFIFSKCLFFYELFYTVFMLFYLNLIYIFMCIYLLFIVCCKVWTLGVWGELACHKRLFNPPLQFSRLGTWCPTYICASIVCLIYVFG